MRVLIKDKGGKGFLALGGNWVQSDAEAHDFENIPDATERCRQVQEEDVVIIIRYGDPKYDIEFPCFGRD